MFFTKITTSYRPKNKLQGLALEHIKRLDHLLVEDLADFQQQLTNVVQRANSRHPRCKALAPHCRKNSYSAGDYLAGVDGLVTISIYKLRGTLQSPEPGITAPALPPTQQGSLFS